MNDLVALVRQGMTSLPAEELIRMPTLEWQYRYTAQLIHDAGFRLASQGEGGAAGAAPRPA